jgi:methyl-accepting chemotaxis protein
MTLPAETSYTELPTAASEFSLPEDPILSALTLSRDTLQRSAEEISSETNILSQRFQALAESSLSQVERIELLVKEGGHITINGETLQLQEALGVIKEVLDTATGKILTASKFAVEMAQNFDNANASLTNVSQLIDRVRAITKQTRLLSLNAAIEARMAGDHGHGFGVVAQEVKVLSNEIHGLSNEIEGSISNVIENVEASYESLKASAAVDMNDNILLGSRIEEMMDSIKQQSDAFQNMLSETADTARNTADTINSTVIGMQFQDRVCQHLGNIEQLLGVISDQLATDGDTQENVLHALKDALSLSDLQTQLMRIAGIKNDEADKNVHPDTEDDDGIELF